MSKYQPIDWQRVCLDIRGSGISLDGRAAEVVGASGWRLNRMARGEYKEPPFGLGLRLLQLHRERCPEKHQHILDQISNSSLGSMGQPGSGPALFSERAA